MTPIRLLKILRTTMGVIAFLAAMVTLPMSLSAYNRLRIHSQREHHVPTTYVVTGLRTTPDMDNAEGLSTLVGTVNGQTEYMIPGGGDRDRASLAARYPPGSTLPVLYNPNETTAIIQNETLRVLPFDPGFWEREDRLRRALIQFVLAPFPIAFLLYLLCRYLHNRAYEAVLRQHQAAPC